MQPMKEKAANIAASAKSGKQKAKAVVDEKLERMSANDETEKQMATQKKEERIHEAEHQKQQIYEINAAARQTSYSTGAPAPHSYSTTGTHQMSALQGHGTGEPKGQITEGVAKSNPIETATGTKRPSAEHNTHVGCVTGEGYTTGGAYPGVN